MIGQDFYEIEAEIQTAQSVTPGQGQTVNVAGVEVGEIKSVKLEDGRAIIGMKIEPRYKPRLPRRDDPAAAQDRPEGHGRRAHAGHRGRRPAARGRPDPGLADAARTSTSTRSSPSLDADTRDYLTLLLNDGGQGAEGQRPRARQHDPPDRADREALAQGQRAARQALGEHQARGPQLLAAHEGARRQGRRRSPTSSSTPTRSSRASPARTRRCARRCASCRPSLQITQTTLAKSKALTDELGPTLRGAAARRPRARPDAAPAAAVPAHHHADHPRRAAPVRARRRCRRSRSCARRCSDLAAVTPDLTATFKILNYLLNELAYNPPGDTDEGYLFWFSWANHLGADACSPPRTRTARSATAS